MSTQSIRPTNLRYIISRSGPHGSRANQWFFSIKSRNGNAIVVSEGYKRRANALKTLLLLAPPNPRIEVLD